MTALHRPLAAPRAASDPLTRLRWPDRLPAVIAVLMTVASLGGLFLPGLYRDNTWSTAAFQGTDLAALLFAVPVLVTALVCAQGEQARNVTRRRCGITARVARARRGGAADRRLRMEP